MNELLPSGNHFGDPTEMVCFSFSPQHGIEKIKFSEFKPVTNCHELPSQGGRQIASPLDGILTSRAYGEERQLYEIFVQLPTCVEVRR